MAKFELYAQIDVPLPGHQYPIIICRGGLNQPQALLSYSPITTSLYCNQSYGCPSLFVLLEQNVFKYSM